MKKHKRFVISIYLNPNAYAITVANTTDINEEKIIIESCYYSEKISYKNIFDFKKQLEEKYEQLYSSSSYIVLVNENGSSQQLNMIDNLQQVPLDITQAIISLKALANDGIIEFKDEILLNEIKNYRWSAREDEIEINHRAFSLFIFMNHLHKVSEIQNDPWDLSDYEPSEVSIDDSDSPKPTPVVAFGFESPPHARLFRGNNPWY